MPLLKIDSETRRTRISSSAWSPCWRPASVRALALVYAFDIARPDADLIHFLPVFAIGFAIAPALAERLRISGDPSTRPPGSKPPFGYVVRSSLLVAFGFALVALLALLFCDRFT